LVCKIKCFKRTPSLLGLSRFFQTGFILYIISGKFPNKTDNLKIILAKLNETLKKKKNLIKDHAFLFGGTGRTWLACKEY
jgi:hypothetical protein